MYGSFGHFPSNERLIFPNNLDYELNCSTNTVIFRFIGGVRVNPRSQGWSVLPHIDVFGESQFCVTPRIWKRLQPKRAVELLYTATNSARRGVSTCRSIENKRINGQDEESDLIRAKTRLRQLKSRRWLNYSGETDNWALIKSFLDLNPIHQQILRMCTRDVGEADQSQNLIFRLQQKWTNTGCLAFKAMALCSIAYILFKLGRPNNNKSIVKEQKMSQKSKYKNHHNGIFSEWKRD